MLALSRKRAPWAGEGRAEFAKLALLIEGHRNLSIVLFFFPFSKTYPANSASRYVGVTTNSGQIQCVAPTALIYKHSSGLSFQGEGKIP